jgi:hypothetical protein
MDSFSVFMRAESAREEIKNGQRKVRYYDYAKALKLLRKRKVRNVGMFMDSDRGWTYDNIGVSGLKRKSEIAGINGSVWDIPMIEIDGEEMECWTYIEPKNQIVI